MANGGTVSLTYIINNSQFNSKIADMKKNLQTLQTACKNSAREVDLYGKNLETLGKKFLFPIFYQNKFKVELH